MLPIIQIFGDHDDYDCSASTLDESRGEYMILDNMHGDTTDQSRENAGVHERSYLQKMESGHACILTWKERSPTIWLDLMDVACQNLLKFLLVYGVFAEENPQKC